MPDILSQDEIDALLTATGTDDGDGGGGDIGSLGSGPEMKASANKPISRLLPMTLSIRNAFQKTSNARWRICIRI